MYIHTHTQDTQTHAATKHPDTAATYISYTHAHIHVYTGCLQQKVLQTHVNICTYA
jgi:hypothetical protein